MSANGFSFLGFCPRPSPGLRPWTLLGDFRPRDPLGYNPPPLNENLRRRHRLENKSNVSGLTGYSGRDRHGLNPQMSLAPFPHCETYWSRIRRWTVRNDLKFWSFLQSKSVNDVCMLLRPPTGASPLHHICWELPSPSPWAIAVQNENSYRATA